VHLFLRYSSVLTGARVDLTGCRAQQLATVCDTLHFYQIAWCARRTPCWPLSRRRPPPLEHQQLPRRRRLRTDKLQPTDTLPFSPTNTNCTRGTAPPPPIRPSSQIRLQCTARADGRREEIDPEFTKHLNIIPQCLLIIH
jgi:hypothetical protein